MVRSDVIRCMRALLIASRLWLKKGRIGDMKTQRKQVEALHHYTAVIERCPSTNLYVGYIPGFPGAHSQGETLDELNANLKEVIEMLLEDGEPVLEAEFVGIQAVAV